MQMKCIYMHICGNFGYLGQQVSHQPARFGCVCGDILWRSTIETSVNRLTADIASIHE